MSEKELFVGNTLIKNEDLKISGEYVSIEGEEFYRISNYNDMKPFFMSIVSASDHWLFISSNGALSAGRRNPNSALFPYYTDDKITDSSEYTGSKTILRVIKSNKKYLWEPFSERYQGVYSIERNIYKNRLGNKILFEEINNDFGIKFTYSWTFSNKFGIVKKSTLTNQSDKSIEIEILDGIQNIIPFGVDSDLQNQKSTLVDAYKKNELDQESGLGQFMLSAMIVDKAEPSEALKTTSVWSVGINPENYLLSSPQLANFRKGANVNSETDVRAERGAYFINSTQTIQALSSINWYLVGEVNQSITDLEELRNEFNKPDSLVNKLEEDIKISTKQLLELVGKADGIQVSNDKLSTGRHFSNVLYNIMRGGVFEDQYEVETADLKAYISDINQEVYTNNSAFINELPPTILFKDLLTLASKKAEDNLQRIIFEYLPLSFSRRHGDPSRPWNLFSIDIADEKGGKVRNYEGNWRDIFQNWEALAHSFPEYIESMILKFVNASTVDGYNPYRISRKGIDWEVVDPEDPWAFIGYWGDHQLIYLLKLLELSNGYHPEKLGKLLTQRLNVYANVPYKIKGYEDILTNSSDTIEFDYELAKTIEKRTDQVGSDGKLVWNDKDQIVKANLAEKILVSVLTKLYNFIPEAGIWLNTQRPEWNDANNALVGNGVSMVTLYHLKRFLHFGIKLFGQLDGQCIELNKPVADLLDDLYYSYSSRLTILEGKFSDVARKKMMDDLGKVGELYRKKAYSGFSGELCSKNAMEIISMFYVALEFVDHSIEKNKRKDGLYHAYNLIEVTKKATKVKGLYEMLEGQVAILSSQSLGAEEASSLLDDLKNSNMYREDQYSYMLYPDRKLPLFLDKNTLPIDFVEGSQLIKALVKDGNTTLIQKGVNGNYHFNGNFHNGSDLEESLKALSSNGYTDLVSKEYDSFLDVFEQMFDHNSFTGRSGTFYGYEGLGSIYWHMVSKLLMGVQENILSAQKEKASAETIGNLTSHYYEIRAGIGVNKSPELYGAFPTDAYSHTPLNAGAQQPGMTGQVKEDIINRWAELGVIIDKGQISFEPTFLRKEEFLNHQSNLDYYNIEGEEKSIPLQVNSLAFTYCQVPIIYHLSNEIKMDVYMLDGSVEKFNDRMLSSKLSQELFNRTNNVVKIECYHIL